MSIDTNSELERLLQESLNLLRQPHPVIQLTREQAGERATLLRKEHLPYSAIAKVMGIYHGIWYGEAYWRRVSREAGCPPSTYLDGTPRVPPWLGKAGS